MHKRLGELLVTRGTISAETLEAALAQQQTRLARLGSLLIDDAALEVSAEAVLGALSEQLGVPAVDLGQQPPTDEAHGILPPPLCRRLEVVPLFVEGEALHLGMVDPTCALARDEVMAASGYTDIRPHLLLERDFAAFLKRTQNTQSVLRAAIACGQSATIEVAPSHATGLGMADPAPPVTDDTIALVDHWLHTALERRASELHLEPFQGSSRVRLRVDGRLQTLMTLPRRVHAAARQRLRELAGLGPSDPGRGVLRVTANGQKRRFELLSLSTVQGEKVALVSVDFEPRRLDALNLTSDQLDTLRTALRIPQGLFLVVGPRASGRTTTAFALAAEVNRSSRQVVVVTESAQQSLPGALVVPIREAWDTVYYVRHALAHDPDVLVIDSASDPDTLHAAARAAINGHMVIATVPGGRALEVITRAVAAGVPAYTLAAGLRGIIAQRLCRQIDSESAVAYLATDSELEELGIPAEAAAAAQFKEPRPAASNAGSGYRGLVGIHELVLATPALRAAIRDGQPDSALLTQARADGFHTLWEDAIVKVMAGQTSVEELRAALTPAD